MNETVLVTLRVKGFSQDYELPCNIELAELYPRLREALKQTRKFLDELDVCDEIVLETEGHRLSNSSATLSDYGIRSGNILNIVRKEEKPWRLKKSGC